MPRARAGHQIYGWVVGAAGISLALFFSRRLESDQWTALLFFTVLASSAEYLDIRLSTGVRLSATFATVLPCFLLVGTPGAICVSMLSSLLGNALPRRRPLNVAVFNLGQYALSWLGAGGVYHALEGSEVFLWRGGTWLAVAGLILSYFVVNHVLVTVYVAWRDVSCCRQFPPRVLAVWQESVGWDALTYLLTVPPALTMAEVFQKRGPGGAALVFVPLVAMAYILRLHMELRAAHRRLTAIHQLAQRLNAALERERVLDMLPEAVKSLVSCDVCAVYLREAQDGILSLARLEHPRPVAFSLPCLCLGQGPLGRLAEEGRAAVVADAVAAGWVVPDPEDPVPPRGAAAVPLTREGGLVGFLWVSSSRPGGYSAQELQALQILGNQAAVALQNAMLYRRAEELSITDDLTGLTNHRYFMRRLQDSLLTARARGEAVALLYVDLDDLGQYNDSYGHLVGDELLREFGETLRSAVRESDLPSRYGGDEFAVILAGASRQEALAVAERIREKLENHSFQGPAGPLRVTASIGIALFPEDAETATDLVRVADRAMYVAKTSGGNRVFSVGE